MSQTQHVLRKKDFIKDKADLEWTGDENGEFDTLADTAPEIDNMTRLKACTFCTQWGPDCSFGRPCHWHGEVKIAHPYAAEDCEWFETATERVERHYRNKIEVEYAKERGIPRDEVYSRLLGLGDGEDDEDGLISDLVSWGE